MIREAQFAGSFYPAGENELLKLLGHLFSKAKPKSVKNPVVALLVPHAGYIYSGIVAASAYNQIAGKNIKNVVIFGPSHHYIFKGASVWPGDKWKSPLGSVDINKNIVNILMQSSQYYNNDAEFHENEHSLEVQVPFLQYVLKDFNIVPVVFGMPDPDVLVSLSKGVVKLLEMENTMFVLSSDLYHGYSHEECVKTDAYTREVIMKMDPDLFYKEMMQEKAMACGGVGIATFLFGASEYNIKPIYIDYTNTHEVTGDFSGYVVGYTAMAFVKRGE